MTTKFKDYTVDIIDDSNYSLESGDHVSIYEKVYFDKGEHQPISKHGIKITKDEKKVSSALICGTGGATGINEKSFIITGDKLLLCCCDSVYSFRLPDLILNWNKQLDQATCFGIYEFKDDFIIHGELEIKRIDINGNVKWDFSAKDIFVTPDGTESLKLTGDKIEVTDWTGDRYVLNEKGQLTT